MVHAAHSRRLPDLVPLLVAIFTFLIACFVKDGLGLPIAFA
jgi:hypothetical protein